MFAETVKILGSHHYLVVSHTRLLQFMSSSDGGLLLGVCDLVNLKELDLSGTSNLELPEGKWLDRIHAEQP